MKRTYVLLLACLGVLWPLGSLGGDTQVNPSSGGGSSSATGGLEEKFAACASGAAGRGYGLHQHALGWDCYEQTCGNYAWTAHVGGTECINTGGTWDCTDWMDTPTHEGGAGFDIVCTDTLDSETGRYEPDNTCEENDVGQTFHINTETDLALAIEMACPGGEILVPNGVYVQRSAGFKNDSDPQSTYNMDGTPDFDGGAAVVEVPISRVAQGLRRSKWQLEDGKTIRMQSTDLDGRYSSPEPGVIPYKNGVWVINDQNSRGQYRYGGTCSGGANNGNPCVHTSIDCPGGACSGGFTTFQWPNFIGGQGRASQGSRCEIVDEGGGSYSCNPDTYATTINDHGGFLHSGHMHLREAFSQTSPDMCLSGFTNDTDINGLTGVVCDGEPTVMTTTGSTCTLGSVDISPPISVAEKIIFEDHLQQGKPAYLIAGMDAECNDRTSECASPAYNVGPDYLFIIYGADAHCSVTTATQCIKDSQCPGGETCELDTCDGGEGFEFWADNVVASGRGFPFHGGIINEAGNGTYDPQFYAMVVDPAQLAPVRIINGTFTDNNYYDAKVTTSNCNGCPADSTGSELWDDTESMGMEDFGRGIDYSGGLLKNMGFEWVSTSANSILDGNGVRMEDGFFKNVTYGRPVDTLTFSFDHGIVENVVNGQMFTSWGVVKVSNSEIRTVLTLGGNASPNALMEYHNNIIIDSGGFDLRTGTLIFEGNRYLGGRRLIAYDPEEDTSVDLVAFINNHIENLGKHVGASSPPYGRNMIAISDVADSTDSATYGRFIFDGNYVTSQESDLCFFHWSGRSCPNGNTCASPTPMEIGRTFATITNNTFRETENAAGTSKLFCVEPAGGAVKASTAANLGIDRFQGIRYGNTWNGTPVPDQPYQMRSISDAPSAAEGPPGVYFFYDDAQGDLCADDDSNGVLDLSASAAFTCDGAGNCSMSHCQLRDDGTWAQF